MKSEALPRVGERVSLARAADRTAREHIDLSLAHGPEVVKVEHLVDDAGDLITVTIQAAALRSDAELKAGLPLWPTGWLPNSSPSDD